MNKFRLMSRCAIFLAANILFFAGDMQAKKKHANYISDVEMQEIANNRNEHYVYLGKNYSDLYDVISRINELDSNQSSVTKDLQEHIEGGFSIGLQRSVIEALEYAERVLQKNAAKINDEEAHELANVLDMVIDQVANDALTIEPQETASSDQNKDCCPSFSYGMDSDSSDCHDCTIITEDNRIIFPCPVKIKKGMKVFGKAEFRDDVIFKEDVCFKDEVCFADRVKFKKNVKFEENVNVEGTLTTTDLVVLSCIDNLCVQNLTVIDIIVPGSCLDSLCVNTLSITDLVVLSCVDNLCVTNLSVTDINVASCIDHLCVTNLTVSDLIVENISVVGCIASLCVTDLSAADESISGTLSVNNEVVTNLTVLSCMDSLCVNNLSVGEIVIGSCLDSLCVIDLSATDASISGTLSVNNEVVTHLTVLSCMDSLCVNNLSVGDIVITSCLDSLCVNSLSVVDETVSGTLSVNNEVVANLTVTNCIDSLCVIDLSAVDVSISGTLSVNEIVTPSISTCDIIVNCDILMHNTAGAGIGNILKDGVSFMHNAGTDNTFLGILAGNFATTGAENVGVGRNALFSNTTGFENDAIGGFALTANTIGENNNAMGAFALVSNTTGNENTGIGGFSLSTNTTGSGNVAVGFQSGFSLGAGNNNVFVGNNSALVLATGFTNVIIGYNSGLSLTSGSNNIYIANPGVTTESGIIRIGTAATHTSTFIQGIFGSVVGGTGLEVFVDAAGQLGTVVSSRRFKNNIKDLGSNVSENIYNLRPVSFMYNADESRTQQYGLIAEEVDQVFPELVIRDEEGAPYTVRYHLLPLLLLNEVQKLSSTVHEQGAAIKRLKLDNKYFAEMMQVVMEKLNALSA